MQLKRVGAAGAVFRLFLFWFRLRGGGQSQEVAVAVAVVVVVRVRVEVFAIVRQSNRFFSLPCSIKRVTPLIPSRCRPLLPSNRSEPSRHPQQTIKTTHHSKAKTHSVLPGLPGHGADAAAGESAADAVDDIDQPHRCSAVAAARATAVAPSGLEAPENSEGGPPATR